MAKVLNKNHSIGEIIADPPYTGCKKIDNIPNDQFKIFDIDIEYRKKQLENYTDQAPNTKQAVIKRLEGWLESFEDEFSSINENTDINSIDHPSLVSFCPVTWKSIEYLFHHDIL